MIDRELHEFLADPALQAAYHKWANDPMTERVIRIVEILNKPHLPGDTVNLLPHALSHACQCAVANTIRQLQTLDGLLETVQEEEPTYGSDDTLKDWNRSVKPQKKPKARK